MLIYIVDDNPDDRELERKHILDVFPDAAIREFTEATEFASALEKGASEPDLVVTDYQLKWSTGLEVVERVKERFPDCPVIMFTGTGDEEVAVAAMKAGAEDYVVKSAKHFGQFRTSVKTVVENAQHRRTIARTEAQLRDALRQKELLLQELNHRTKNNLLTVMSLMKLRARRSDNPEIKELLSELAGRVQSLASVQSQILASDDLGRIDFAAYLADVAAALQRMHGNGHIALRVDLDAELVLPVQRAGPLALLVYEVILNSFKHAFPALDEGSIFVGIDGSRKEQPVIVVEDDGVGFDHSAKGMGTTLIGELAQEADAEVLTTAGRTGGTRVEVRLKPEQAG